MEIKTINYLKKEFVDYDDFVVSGEVYIGPENMDFVYEVFEFNVVSIKRLYSNFDDNAVMLSRGWMIVKTFDEKLIELKIESIVSRCNHLNDEENYVELSAYFRRLN
ncbi:Immunity protein 8 [Lachnospiraceae bacterium C7]|nr:Immunity protein 8 [Lachnospiraceae bacterium C7]